MAGPDIINSTEALVAAIDANRLVERTSRYVRKPSVNPFDEPPSTERSEQDFAEMFADELRAAGVEVELREVEPGRPNVIGRIAGSDPSAPTLMLAGHLDTVGIERCIEPFSGRVEDGRLYGRGSCDMKAALAAFVEVALIVHESQLTLGGDLLIVGTADEENLMVGSARFASYEYEPDFCIVGEPTSLSICPIHKGQIGMTITTHGRAVHSSVPHEGVNAIEKMGLVLSAFADYQTELDARDPHPLAGYATFSPGVIGGGSMVAIVPDGCELTVDRRMIPGETVDQVLTEYRARLDAIAATDPEFRYEISDPSMFNEPLDTPTDHLIVATCERAVTAATGSDSVVEAFPAGTDAPNFGCPAVILGPGSLAQAHTVDEYVAIDEITKAAEVYLRATLELLGRAG